MFEELRKGTTGALDKAKLAFSRGSSSEPSATNDAAASDVEEQSQPGRLEELAEYCPQLSFQERLIGFAVSFSLGCMYCPVPCGRVGCDVLIAHLFRFKSRSSIHAHTE